MVKMARLSRSGSLEFRVRLPAPRDLLGPEGVVHATQATLSWTAPITALAVESLLDLSSGRVLDGDHRFGSGCGTDWRWRGSIFCDSDLRGWGGDPSGELLLDSAVPEVLEVDPQFVFQGDQIRAVVRGANLLFLQDDVDVALGQGIEVAAVDVRDVDTLIVRLDVAPDAVPGPRLVSVSSGELGASLSSALQVIDGKERPTVSRLEPPLGRQGSQLELEIYTSKALDEVYQVDLGEGILVQEVLQLEDSCIQVKGWIDENAPLGERMVTVDDGERIWSGEAFKVLDRSPAPVGCSTQGSSGASGWVAWVFCCCSALGVSETGDENLGHLIRNLGPALALGCRGHRVELLLVVEQIFNLGESLVDVELGLHHDKGSAFLLESACVGFLVVVSNIGGGNQQSRLAECCELRER